MTLDGLPALNRRLNAISKGTSILRSIQLQAVRQAKELVPRKTGYLARSIGPGSLTNSFAIVHANANYAAFVEFGTRRHVIRPRNKKVLSWPANQSGRRLSGRARSNAGPRVFARKVNHPGTKAQPFLVPGARKALEGAGFRDIVTKAWNDAA
jgi:hypothetical protein